MKASRQDRPKQMHDASKTRSPGLSAAPAYASVSRSLFLRLWPIGLLLLLVFVQLHTLLLSSPQEVINTPDIEDYFLRLHAYARESLTAGLIPLWNPYNYCGTPFAANPQCSVFYPLSWFYLLMPVGHAHKWMIAVHIGLAGVFAYLLLRRLENSRSAALAGALPWTLGSYALANACVGHLTMLFTMAWMPLVVYCYDRTFGSDKIRWLLVTGLVLAVQLAAGEPQNTYYTVLLLAVYGLVRTLKVEPSAPLARASRCLVAWLAGLAVVGLVAVCVSAIQLLPTAEYAIHSDRSQSGYEFATNRSFPVSSFVGFLVPWSDEVRRLTVVLNGQRHDAVLNWEFAGYSGILTLILCGVSFAVRKRPVLTAARVLLVVGVVLMLGAHTPAYHLLYRFLPGLSWFRIPSRAVILVLWPMSIMTAFGFGYLFGESGQWRSRRWRLITSAALAVLLACMVTIASTVKLEKAVRASADFSASLYKPTGLSDPVLLVPLLCIAATLSLIALLARMPRSVAMAAVLAVLSGDLLLAGPRFPLRDYTAEEDRSVNRMLDLRRAGGADAGLFRVDLAARYAAANAAMVARVGNVNGYWPLAPMRLYRLVHAMRGFALPLSRHQFHDELYERDYPLPLRILNIGFTNAIDRESGKTLILGDAKRYDRAWIATRAEVIADEEASLKRVCATEFDSASTVLLEKPPTITMGDAGSTQPRPCAISMAADGSLDIEAESPVNAYLVISQSFYPGWRAWIDGKETPLERVDYALAALPLPAGQHRITCRYVPLSFRLGAAVTGLSCLAGGILLLIDQKRRRRMRRDR